MEPKPKGIGREYHLPWLSKAVQEYQSSADEWTSTETSFFRGNTTIEVLDRILPDISQKPNILLIGLGLDAEPINCTYEPFRVAAHLQGRGVDYTMTLVDVNEEVIEDVRNREKLFLAYHQYYDGLSKKFAASWQKYLADTQQEGREIFEREEGLQFSYNDQNSEFVGGYLGRGIAVADVSPQFRHKLATGEVSLVHSDIAVANIHQTGPFDYVEFTNVLYLMQPAAQQLAMANVATSLADGGRLLVNDIGGYVGKPFFSRFGGWFDDEKMRQLGLGVEDYIAQKETSQTVLLKKV